MKQVVYRKEKAGTFAGEVHAIFPEYCDGYFAGYDENGIESSYSLAFLTDCTEDATPEESAKLRAMLADMGQQPEEITFNEFMRIIFPERENAESKRDAYSAGSPRSEFFPVLRRS